MWPTVIWQGSQLVVYYLGEDESDVNVKETNGIDFEEFFLHLDRGGSVFVTMKPSDSHVIDNAHADRESTRDLRPFVESYGIRQIILLSRQRVDEQAMPAFKLEINEDDLEYLRGNLYRFMDLIIPETERYNNYHQAIETILTGEQDGSD